MKKFGTDHELDNIILNGSTDDKYNLISIEYGLDILLFDKNKELRKAVKEHIQTKYSLSVREFCNLFLSKEQMSMYKFPKYFQNKYKLINNVITIDIDGSIIDNTCNLDRFKGGTNNSLLKNREQPFVHKFSNETTEEELDILCENIVSEFCTKYNDPNFMSYCKENMSGDDYYNFLVFLNFITGSKINKYVGGFNYYLRSKTYTKNPEYVQAIKKYLVNIVGIQPQYVEYAYKYRHLEAPAIKWGIHFFATNTMSMAKADQFPFQDIFCRAGEITRFVNKIIGERNTIKVRMWSWDYNSGKGGSCEVERSEGRRIRYNMDEKLIMINEQYLAYAPTLLEDAIAKNGEMVKNAYLELCSNHPGVRFLFDD